MEEFRLGFADRTLGLRLPDKRRKEGADLRGRLEGLGVFRASGHEHFAGSLVIPVFGEHGRSLRSMGGRSVTTCGLAHPGTCICLARTGASGTSRRWRPATVIVCESLIDALTFWCAGFRHVTASYGAGGSPPTTSGRSGGMGSGGC